MTKRDLTYAAVGDGWLPIVAVVTELLDTLDPDFIIDQIKEKFGGLRYYFTPSVDYDSEVYSQMKAIVDGAEARCWSTCEQCGEPGTTRYGGWIRTLCDKDETEYQERIKE